MSVIFAVIFVLFFTGQSSAVSHTLNTCESQQYKPAECSVTLHRRAIIAHVTVSDKLSKSACTYGTSFGIDSTKKKIWVKNGCRAKFNVYTCRHHRILDCDSWGYKFASCPVPSARKVNFVMLLNKRSKSACTLYNSYGPDVNKIWVDNGCRGRFVACY